MMITLQLFDRAQTGDNYHGNITGLARNWRRSTRAVGGFWTGDFMISNQDLSRGDLIDMFNAAIGWRVIEKSYGAITWEGEIVQLRLTLDGVTWVRSLDSERWRNKVKVQWGGGETA